MADCYCGGALYASVFLGAKYPSATPMLISTVVSCAGLSADIFVLTGTPTDSARVAAYFTGLLLSLAGAKCPIVSAMVESAYLPVSVCPRASHPSAADA